MPMRKPAVPVYKLFGEQQLWPTPEPVHHETIAERSALYDWEIASHSHDNLLQILFLNAGEASMTLETRNLTLEPPCVVVLPAGSVHGFRFSRDIDGRIISIPQTILGELLVLSPELLTRLEHSAYHPLSRRSEALKLARNLFQRFAREYQGNGPGRLTVMMCLLAEMLVGLARASGEAATHAAGSRRHKRLRRFRALIDSHFREWRPVTFYAERLGVSAAQLNNCCRSETGRSAQEMIHERILLEARRLLSYSDLEVTAVCYVLGFKDPAYFSRFFSRRQGVSPSRFKRELITGECSVR
jgi:AraC family transcriptional regulator, transcriptional activator of pobA